MILIITFIGKTLLNLKHNIWKILLYTHSIPCFQSIDLQNKAYKLLI